MCLYWLTTPLSRQAGVLLWTQAGGHTSLASETTLAHTQPAVPLPKLAVKQLYPLQVSHLFRPMRTFDETRAPGDLSAHTSWVDLLDETSPTSGSCGPLRLRMSL